MSRFFTDSLAGLKAYTPGEQPRGGRLIKLNTNENPFLPVPGIAEKVRETVSRLNLYSDPECTALREAVARRLKIGSENLIMTNGSDEALNFAFIAFCDDRHPAVFADITYGFYPVFAQVNKVPYQEVPLRDDWSIDPRDYDGYQGTIFLANPNAPTGLAMTVEQIRQILDAHPHTVTVVDEAYVDFGAESILPLIGQYDNLLVVQTFSKSRSLAGLRLGFAAGNPELIRDLKTIQYSTNPYNVDMLAQAAGVVCVEEDAYNMDHVRIIRENREWARQELLQAGFQVTDSRTNFLFVRHPSFPGSSLRDRLRERGVLIRWFDQDRIRDWSRISVGTREQMETLMNAIHQLLEG